MADQSLAAWSEKDDFFQSVPPDKQLILCNTCNDAIRDMIVFKERAQKSFRAFMKYWCANMFKQTTGNAVSVPSSSQISNVTPLYTVEIEVPKKIKCEGPDPFEIDKTITETRTLSIIYDLFIDIKEENNPDSFNSKPIVNNSTAVAANRNDNLNCNFVINKVSTQTNGNSNSNIAPVVLSSATSQVVNKKLKIVKLDDRGNIEDIGEGVMCRSPSVSKDQPNPRTSEYRTKKWYIQIVTREEILKKMEERRNKPEFLKAPYKCVSCVRVFGKEQLLEQHKKACHTEGTEFICFACRTTFENFHKLNAHFHVHTKDSCIYYCTTCEFETKHMEFMRDHVCLNDGSEALPPKDPNTMKLSSSRSLYYCPKCEFISPRSRTLILHYTNTHKTSPKSQCGECGKFFKNKSGLRSHVDTAHRGKKRRCTPAPVPMYCNICDKWYSRKSAYYIHVKNKHAPGDSKFECNECGKKLLSAEGLESHKEFHELMKRGVKNHKCSVCGNAYYTQKVLRRHIQVKHEKKRTSRDHVCEVCGMAFFTKKMLQGHSVKHSDERPYKCSFCGVTFKYSAAFYSHTRLKHKKNRNDEGSPNKKKTR